jgi:hypothetical protein
VTQPRTAEQARASTEPLHHRAIDNLRYIRETMERAGSFTAVSGTGSVGIGLIAIPAAYVAGRQTTPTAWMMAWIVAAACAVVIEVTLTSRKAKGLGVTMMSGPGRKFALAFTPTLVAGAILTWALTPEAPRNLLVGAWLLLYGAGVTAGGALSVPVVPVMGLSFMGMGVVGLIAPVSLSNWIMLAGFGGLHLGFGAWIARRYGG